MESEIATAPELADALAASITAGLVSHIERTRRAPLPHAAVYASAKRPCDRRMVYELTAPDQQPPHSAELLAKFQRGEDRERDLTVNLIRAGRDADPSFDVIGQQQRFQLRDRKGRAAISGKVDGRIRVTGATTSAAPFEIKAWSPHLVDRVRSFNDLFDSPWMSAGGYQLLAYLFGAGEPYGFLILDSPGLPRILPVTLVHHLDRMESFLAQAERVLDHVDAGTLPDYLQGDAAECNRCPFFGGTCNPPLTANVTTVLSDPELESILERREELRGVGEEYARLDRHLKERLRGVEHGICGSFVLRGTWGKQSRIDLPPALKAQYTVTDPRGRFTLQITKVSTGGTPDESHD